MGVEEEEEEDREAVFCDVWITNITGVCPACFENVIHINLLL